MRKFPLRLFVAGRIETRGIIEREGFFPRVDCYESPEIALRFHTKPCDMYEIYTNRLVRKKMSIAEHPFGKLYSYHEHIPKDKIRFRITYR